MNKKVLPLIIFFLTFLALSLVPLNQASAQQPTPSDDEVNAIASQLFCPVCQNTPLDVCPTQACHQWRELIRQMLAEGKSATEIKQYFVTYYGASVLSEPPHSGFNWLIYIIPPTAFLLGAFFLIQAFRSWKKPAAKPAFTSKSGYIHKMGRGSSSTTDDPYVSRIEDDLKKRD